jgi:flagellar biosynthetic protein FliQ
MRLIRLYVMPPIPNPQSLIPNPSPMDPQVAIDIGRQAIWNMLIIGGPILTAGMAVGLLIGLLQALTQIQEQTVAFVPKLIAMVLILSLTLPWLIARMVQYSSDLIAGIPGRF